ncbi:hypothetical protein QJQ45_007001 [Haematococcus lacustris]|nr:hypothetical protein QJQ45_007001 [Haematococcus lacustris]
MFSAFDVLMGSDWLQSNGALLDYLARTVTLQMSANKTVLKCEPTAPILAPHCAHILAKHSHATVSAKVAYKWLRKGGQSLVALISSQPVNPTPPPTNLLSVHPTPSPTNVLSNDPVPHSHPITSPSDNPINYPTSIPPAVAAQLTTLISEFEDVFAPFNKLPPQRPVGHTIPLQPGCKPPALPSYKMSQPELLEMKKQVAAFLEQGIIEPSSSPYVAPVLFVKKKSGELRMCVDYRQLNKITLRDQYPLPRVDDLFDRLANCTVFSSLDLQAGYHQIRIPDEDVPKTALRTPTGLYQFKVLCFGLTNAPATFQRVMNNAFADVINDCALVYIDDILIMSKSVPDHFNHLRRVLELLRKHQFQAKLSKCEFLKTALKFLGHIVSDQGIAVDPDKQEAPFGGGGSYCAAAAASGAAAAAGATATAGAGAALASTPCAVCLCMVDQYDQDQHGLYRTRERNQIVVPNCPELKTRILVEMHDAQFAGHVGITKTLERISRLFWWPCMRSEVRHYVANCDACQRNKSVNTKPGGLLTPLAIPYDRRLSKWWQSNVKQARHFMELAQRRQAHLANKGRKEVEYHTGQLVLLSTKNLRMKPGKAKKLLPRFIGPFKVLEHVGPVAVRLDLPQAMARMHPVFHVSLLRPYTSEHPHLPPPVEWLDEAPLYEIPSSTTCSGHVVDTIRDMGGMMDVHAQFFEASHRNVKLWYCLTNKRQRNNTEAMVSRARLLMMAHAHDADALGVPQYETAHSIATTRGEHTVVQQSQRIDVELASSAGCHLLSKQPELRQLSTLLQEACATLHMAMPVFINVVNTAVLAASVDWEPDCSAAQTVRATPCFYNRPWFDNVALNTEPESFAQLRLLFTAGDMILAMVRFYQELPPREQAAHVLSKHGNIRLRWAQQGHSYEVVQLAFIKRKVLIRPGWSKKDGQHFHLCKGKWDRPEADSRNLATIHKEGFHKGVFVS